MKKIIVIITIIVAILFTFLFIKILYSNKFANSFVEKYEKTSVNTDKNVNLSNIPKEINNIKENYEIDDWRLTLVNYDNELPEDFEIELSNIDSTRKFDSRAIDELNQMLKGMKKDGISDVWVQSAYRSIEYQQGLFNDKINIYMKQGKTREEAEKLTLQKINRPGTSDHNLGLAVDFNYVDYNFDTTKGFEWLKKNAENYGFIMRYKKEKEDITKVDYEPWHWRYVGVYNAKKMNELDMCLEEYIDYLKENK